MCMWGAAWPSRGHVGAGGPGEGSPLPGLSPEPPFQRSMFWGSGLALASMDLSPARCLGASACPRPTPQASTGFPGLTQLAQHPSPDPSTGCDSCILLAAQADGPGSPLARPSSSCPLLRTSPPCSLRLVCSTRPLGLSEWKPRAASGWQRDLPHPDLGPALLQPLPTSPPQAPPVCTPALGMAP